MKTKDLILIALVCVNITLAAVAATLYVARSESAAVAGAVASRSGDYVMVTGPLTGARDGLLVIDVVAKRANLYVSKGAAGVTGVWDLTSSRNLAQDFAGGMK